MPAADCGEVNKEPHHANNRADHYAGRQQEPTAKGGADQGEYHKKMEKRPPAAWRDHRKHARTQNKADTACRCNKRPPVFP